MTDIGATEMLSQALKGLMAAQGGGSGITRKVLPIEYDRRITTLEGLLSQDLLLAVAASGDGAVVCVASKVVSEIQGRIIVDPSIGHAIKENYTLDQKIEVLKHHDPLAGHREWLILDQGREKDSWFLAPEDPNGFAADIALTIRERTRTSVDVVLTDSGCGLGKGGAEIGVATFISTPLGATAGLALVHAQRCAAAYEFKSNLANGIASCVVVPESWRSRTRRSIGQLRYPGYLDASREPLGLPGDESDCGPIAGRAGSIWITGLSAAGKTTLAREVVRMMTEASTPCELLDGDEMRTSLGGSLGFGPDARAVLVSVVADVALRLGRRGIWCVASVTSPFAEGRDAARARHEAAGVPFFEVHMSTPLEVCAQRDPKRLYARRNQGLIDDMVGIDIPYEAPLRPELTIDSSVFSVEKGAALVLSLVSAHTTPHEGFHGRA